MRFRNATQVRILDDLLNSSSNQGFFQTFIFENFTDFAMNWFLSDDDIDGDAPQHRGRGSGRCRGGRRRRDPRTRNWL